jgi:choline dehydrogenase-like flavoprotein
MSRGASDFFDVAIAGSGPSGTLAAVELVRKGLQVLMLDVGHDDERYRSLIPDLPFAEIRRTDPHQRRYFLGDDLEGIPQGKLRVGAQLTPPRQFVTRDTEQHLPCSGESFAPMQSLALGGLGAAWGASCLTYSRGELEKAGIYEPGFAQYYDEVAREIGVSAEPADDASRECFAGVKNHLPPLDMDASAEKIWAAYLARRDQFQRRGFSLGRTPLAALSRDFKNRKANPYFDMDFWGEVRQSVFRPRYLLEELETRPNFCLARGNLVIAFADSGKDQVQVHCRDLKTDRPATFTARRLLLCAGAINSARIALNSLGLANRSVPILCNPYTYVPCLNLKMLGRKASERRHSLSHLTALYRPEDDPQELVVAHFFSYGSLLLFKLVKEIPLPPWAGLLLVRLLVNSLVIAGLHHADAPHAGKTMRILATAQSSLPEVRFAHAASQEERSLRQRREKAFLRHLLRLGLLPCARLWPGAAASIHYAGTIPIDQGQGKSWGTEPNGRLLGSRNVYVGDGSTWRYLPAKGLTFTLMANALRVARHLGNDLQSSA